MNRFADKKAEGRGVRSRGSQNVESVSAKASLRVVLTFLYKLPARMAPLLIP